MSFIKFGILATLGEMLGLRISAGWKSHSTLTLLAKQDSPLWL